MALISGLQVALLPIAIKLLSSLLAALSNINLPHGIYPNQASVYDGQCFDVIIVGAGSAGCVVANRLTEVEGLRVLLIEAGDDPQIDVMIPSLFPLIPYSEQEWKLYSENDGYTAQTHKEKRQHYMVGKMLGGTSGSNIMYYVRGHEKDFERWVQAGATGWDWETVLRYFKKSERMTSKAILDGPTGNLHNDKGYLGVSRPEWGKEQDDYLKAFEENGHRIVLDSNQPNNLGYSQPSFTIDPPFRQNTALAFLTPIKDRKNLYVLKNTYVNKVIFDENNRAVGVEAKVNGKDIINLCAKKEVILSAGALNTPRILMSSGVGPKEHLEENGIKVILDSPNVGQNMEDHPFIMITFTSKRNVLSAVNNLKVLTKLDTFPTPSIMGIASLNKSTNAYPDYEVIGFPFPAASIIPTVICSQAFNNEDYICEAMAKAGQRRETFFALHSLLHPESRGSVRLRSSNPEDKPVIDSGLYKNKDDLDKHAYCVEDFISVLNTTFFKNIKGTVVDYGIKQCKDLTFGSHEYWKCHIRTIVQSQWHVSGTCAMGPEGVGVTDERLRVRGVEGVRVVDASAMPHVTSGNINAPVIMLAERASDLIKEDNQWPVEAA